MYSQQASDSKAINSLLKQVEQCTPNNQAVLVVLILEFVMKWQMPCKECLEILLTKII